MYNYVFPLRSLEIFLKKLIKHYYWIHGLVSAIYRITWFYSISSLTAIHAHHDLLFVYVNSLEEILQLQVYIGRCEILSFQLTRIVGKN
jgi:hypothetical protein